MSNEARTEPTSSAAIEARAAEWLAQQDAGRWSEDDARRLEAWLNQDVRQRVAYLRLVAAWRQADQLAGTPAAPALSAALAAPERAANRAPWRIAAALVLACAVAVFMNMMPGHDSAVHATRIGESRALALADGSRIVLNTDTRLRTLEQNGRTVWLDGGEAYFDIAHDPSHPFVVESGSGRVTVLGTRFTVRREGARLVVVVAQGKVRLSDGQAAVELTRDQMAVAHAGAIRRSVHSAQQTARLLAWREGRLVFDRTSLADAAAQFNRYNQRQIVVSDARAAQVEIGGSFAPANVDGFLRLLEQGFGLRVERNGQVVTVSR